MEVQSGIQIIGYLLIPLGLLALFKDIKYLLFLTVFFAGFTATSVYNFGQVFGLQPSYYFAVLFLIKYFFIVLKRLRIYKPSGLISIFIIICIISALMLKINITRNILILNQKNVYTNPVFSINNITQLFNIIFCFILYWFMKDYFNNEPERINSAIKVLIYSTVVICVLGFYQEIAYIKGWQFDKIFRNGMHGNIQPFGSFIRVYATTNEPSMYAYFLAPIFALLLSIRSDIIKHKFLIIILVLISGIISTSTTFVLGIAILLVKIILDRFINLLKLNKNINQKIGIIVPLILLIMIPIILIIFYFNPTIQELLTDRMINKLQGKGASGSERLYAFQTQLDAAFKYPLLGVGYGSARSKDLFSTWLCNIGFIGTGIFIIYIYRVITKLKNTSGLGYGVSNYLFTLFMCAFISVPEPYYLFIWIMISVAESIITQKKISGIYSENYIKK
ncbi:MAG: O-Antigen ligase [Thermoanaerobacterium thermosaccharolyticum]|jgi:hypothetical protein